MQYFYPLRLRSSLHETIWGGRRLERDEWKQLPTGEVVIGESWETETSNRIENGPYAGQTLGELVATLGPTLLGERAVEIFGQRFPLLAKFIDANAQLSVQVHPKDEYAAQHEGGKLGKTEFWYILAAEPGARIVYGFRRPTTYQEVEAAIQQVRLEELLHEEPVQAGDIIFVPAGTVHAIGSGVLLYELQEYSDITYRMYDYGRLTAAGVPRELHIERSLDVSNYDVPQQVKVQPVDLPGYPGVTDRCLAACKYFVTRELHLEGAALAPASLPGKTSDSCIILSSLGASIDVTYGDDLAHSVSLKRGETMILPARLGDFCITGYGKFLYSYVPRADDEALQLWQATNKKSVL